VGTPVSIYLLGVKVFCWSIPLTFFVAFVLWIVVVWLCDGCPFTYVEEYFAHKAWGDKITYDFTRSIVYKLVFRHLQGG